MMSQATCERNPYVFVVGCPRSGTTLLQRMLDHHPRLAVANDTHFIPRALEEVIPQAVADVAGPVDPPLSPELVEWVLGYHRFARLGLVEAIVRQASAEAATYRDFVSALYSEFGRLHGKPLAGEKTPDYVRRLPLLHAVFPWVRTVHIIRDGRDVALSTLEWASEDKGPGKLELWQDEPVAVCALWWQWQVRTGMRDGAVLGPSRYHEVKYEELVARPEATLQSVAAFLGLPFAQEMLHYHVAKTALKPGLSSKKAWLPPTPGLRDWRTQMVERDVALFEAIAGDLMTALGYDRAIPAIPRETTLAADRCRRWWDDEMAGRQARLAERVRSAMDSPSDHRG